MNSNPHNRMAPEQGSAVETLRLIASLPAPADLEERVYAALRRAPRRTNPLAWPAAHKPESGWMRAAAAAAIVLVVAGGGWSVYLRVQQSQTPKVIAMPQRMPAEGGFSGAGAIRTPQTLPGPMVSQPAKPGAAADKAAKKPPAKNPHRQATPAAAR